MFLAPLGGRNAEFLCEQVGECMVIAESAGYGDGFHLKCIRVLRLTDQTAGIFKPQVIDVSIEIGVDGGKIAAYIGGIGVQYLRQIGSCEP